MTPTKIDMLACVVPYLGDERLTRDVYIRLKWCDMARSLAHPTQRIRVYHRLRLHGLRVLGGALTTLEQRSARGG